jgi:thiopurine S-methyltransferase
MMMSNKLDASYWQSRYENNQAGWDLGTASQPIVEYVNQLIDKDLSILIPGCGNAHEAEYLFNQGFKNVSVIDLAAVPLENLKKRVPDFPESQLIQGDFFELNQQYDLIIEQTLFCAIDPILRAEYVKKASELLKVDGKFVGVLFNREFESGPPFGGNKDEYLTYFSSCFQNIEMEICHNSVTPRSGTELFFIARKK